MPLTAVLDGQRVDSVLATDVEWAELKRTYQSRSLVMTCGLPAFPRTSNLKLRHFVHKTGVRCHLDECWSETPQHRAGKSIVARAAAEADWDVRIEHPAPDLSWKADVLAEKDGRRIALEIQWSKQPSSEFSYRQARYASAGLECFWYVHRRNRAAAEEAGVPHVVFDGDGLPLDVFAHKAFQDLELVPLADMTKLLLDGGFVYRVEAKITDITFQLTQMKCNLCRHDSTIWRIGSAALRSRCQQTTTFRRASHTSWTQERLERCLYSEAFRLIKGVAPLAPLRMHYSRTTSSRYLAYGCAHCERGFFGDFFISSSYEWDEVTVPVSTRIPIDEGLLEDSHICPDSGFGRCSQVPREHVGPVFKGYTRTRTSPALEAGVAVEMIGETISVRDAVNIMAGRSWAVPPRSSNGRSLARHKPEPETCDQCGTDPHPEFECLRNQLRAVLNVPESRRHYSDDIRDKIISGAKPLDEGTEFLRRCLQRSRPLR